MQFCNIPSKSAESPYSFQIDRDNELERLGEKYRPSKRRHNYLIYYWLHFRDIRDRVKNVVEIGLERDHSIRMWEEFFPNATIWGIDIDPICKKFEGERRKVIIGDQSDSSVCCDLIASVNGGIDIVIDDGSHKIEHQIRTFGMLFPALSKYGTYVIEDTGGCVRDHKLVVVNEMKRLIDSIMHWPNGFDPRDWPLLWTFPDNTEWIHRNIVGIAFYRWIVFVMRGENPETNPYLIRK